MFAERHGHHHQPQNQSHRRSGYQDLGSCTGNRLRHQIAPALIFGQKERVDAEHQRIVIDGDQCDHECGDRTHGNQKGDHHEFRQGGEDLGDGTCDVVVPLQSRRQSLAGGDQRIAGRL